MNQVKTDRSRTKYDTVKDVAERWHTCERTVRREIQAGRLVAHRFGRSVRISEDDLLIYERLNRKD